MKRYVKFFSLLLAMALVAAACGGDDSSSGDGDAGSGTEQVFFILDWVPKGQVAPFFVALDKGFWAERGLAVQMTRGYGSGDTSDRIGIGEGDFGFADAGVVMNKVSQGLPLIEIAPIASTVPVAAYIDPAAGVTEAADLVGLKGAVDAGDGNDNTFKAWAPSAGIAYDDIDWQYTDGANITSIASGQADFVMDWISNLPEWWLADPPIEPDVIWIGNDIGVYGSGLITQPEYLAANPDIVRAFVEGAMAGYEYVIEGGTAAHNEAIDILFQYNPEIAEQPNAREFHLGNLQLFLTLMLTEDVRDGGLGYYQPDKLDLTIEFMNEWLIEGPDVSGDQAFTNTLDKKEVEIDDFDAAIASLETVLGRANPLTPLLGG
jgi:NitT/TauT family transport system substrate-binding protein